MNYFAMPGLKASVTTINGNKIIRMRNLQPGDFFKWGPSTLFKVIKRTGWHIYYRRISSGLLRQTEKSGVHSKWMVELMPPVKVK